MMDSTQKRDFPFKSVLSLHLLIRYWETAIRSGKVPFGEPLLEHIQAAPELRAPIVDASVLEKHKELISFLMSAVIAPAQTDKELTAATIPFQFKSFFETHAFQKNLTLEQIKSSAIINIPGNDMAVGKTIQACLLILQQFYHVKINFDKPILFTIRNPQNGLDKVYKIEIGRQFFEIVCKREPRAIDPRIIKFLTEKVYDVDLWLQYIRPEDFEFHGFMILRMVDVTEQEMVSSIKYDLLEKDAVSKTESFISIQHKLRSIFGMPDIRLGLAYFDPDNNIILRTEQNRDCWRSLAESDRSESNCENFRGSVYERSWMEKRYITVEDLESYPYKSVVEENLLSNGIKNILLAPLIDEGETIGMLELATTTPGELNPVTANKVESVLPMFTAAVKRVKEEMTTEIRAIIQEECTNIHPVVQWRFMEAGSSVLEKRRRGEPATFGEIAFKEVYPLFGMTDIRNSSIERTAAIREDLMQNLQMAKALVETVNVRRKLPVLDETLFKIDGLLQKIGAGLASGDETSALEFLKREINPLLEHFNSEEEFGGHIQEYREHLDPVFGVVYNKRRDFENSLGMINSMISAYLNEAQVDAQEMFPHYFEKNQTDGIEYTIYLGSSLTKNKDF
ncbi:MAG: GAF domain-containing protein, partial [Cyclobacteriaceae bacterium]